ncbi:phage GP46 family protein [Aureimonas altamirensis]|uniref:phage GP46 family protein n=1 Tax=Aureimonas altamirensis TaxID=370622 RepID=UPI001E5CDB1F|nr:phage GP46 family protein [Aureimonas altamirensis]UHD45349.1 phage GP46 family protein [Aureimonas altamirensis]
MRVVPIDEDAEPILLPDIVWNGSIGDLVVDASLGDLQSSQAIATAVLICLQTDRRVDPSELPDGESNRGWPGDAFDMQPGDVPLGSKLWLLRRRAITDDVELIAADYAREALQTLIEQQAVARVDVAAAADRSRHRLDLDVSLYGRDGSQVHQQRYAVLWDQMNGL